MSEYCKITTSCVSYTNIKAGSEVALLDAVYRAGPISVGVDATNYHFQFYSDGVYAERGCNSHSLNHGMLLVGYGETYDGVEYWIVKNRYCKAFLWCIHSIAVPTLHMYTYHLPYFSLIFPFK